MNDPFSLVPLEDRFPLLVEGAADNHAIRSSEHNLEPSAHVTQRHHRIAGSKLAVPDIDLRPSGNPTTAL